jgi:hypothetical protein|tara:strand:+ start:1876 stop:2382 length:507 start_codon:yes stop_codon:yes gene_type:complete
MIKIVDNFFDYYSHDYYDCVKQLPFYNIDEFRERTNITNQNWPGTRTEPIEKVAPFLFLNVVELIKRKLNMDLTKKGHGMYCHARYENDKPDWIHTDPGYSVLIFLSDTNLESGTAFFDDKDNMVDRIGFVHNRALLFDGQKYRHMSLKNYGDSIDNARLTINTFFDK